jgi:alpha-beta hydrolase superfamily lysophospholipase
MPKPVRDQSWFPEALAEWALASRLGYLAAAYTGSRWLTKASPGKPRQTPADFGLPWEAVHVRTSDGYRLAGWIITPVGAIATVVLFHGVHNNRAQTLGRAAFLAAAGYRCVTFDHRAHGESTGRKTSFGYYESQDVAAVLQLVRERWPGQPCAALGISMGAAALCYAWESTRHLDALILESVYHDIGRAFLSRMLTYPPWFQRLSQGVLWATERRLGLRMGQLAPVEQIEHLSPASVLLVTGAEDAYAPPSDTLRLFERCRAPREMYVVAGAGHRDVFETGSLPYQQRILEFLTPRLAA